MNKLLTILLLALSVSVMGQTYSKDLEKSAKKGNGTDQKDLGICYLKGLGVEVDYKKAYKWLNESSRLGYADGLYYLATMYEQNIVPSKFSDTNKAWELYEQSASLGYNESIDKLIQRYRQSNDSQNLIKWLKKDVESGNFISQFELGKLYYDQKQYSDAETWLKKAADRGNAEAQYIVGMMFLEGKNGQPDNIKAKKYLQMATAQNFPNAQAAYSAIVHKEQQDSIAKARQAAIEQARRDSVARIRELELAAQKRQDSIDIAEGRKLPKKDQLLSGCRVFSRTTQATYSYEFKESYFYRELVALCSNDVLAYYGKSRMDDLDKALYKKSEEYRTDLSNFNKKRNEKMAIVFPLDKLSEPEWEFSSTGFSFRALGTKPSPTDNANLLGLMDLVFPVNPNLVKPDDHLKCWHTIKCSNLEKLQEIRANKDNLEMLYIFKPGAKAISRYWSADVMDYVYLVNPIALYLLNSNTGEVVLDLSNCLRKTGIAADKQRIETYAKNHYNKIKPKKHSTPKQQRCLVCGGKGYTEYYPVGSAVLKRERCTYCYGKGYTIDYVY